MFLDQLVGHGPAVISVRFASLHLHGYLHASKHTKKFACATVSVLLYICTVHCAAWLTSLSGLASQEAQTRTGSGLISYVLRGAAI